MDTFLFCGFLKKENIKIKAIMKINIFKILISAEYKNAKSNKIVPHETFSQPLTVMSTNGFTAFKANLVLQFFWYTWFVQTNPVEWSRIY